MNVLCSTNVLGWMLPGDDDSVSTFGCASVRRNVGERVNPVIFGSAGFAIGDLESGALTAGSSLRCRNGDDIFFTATVGGASSDGFGGSALRGSSVRRSVFGDVAGLMGETVSTLVDVRKGELSFLMAFGDTGGGDVYEEDGPSIIDCFWVPAGDCVGCGAVMMIVFNVFDEELKSSDGRLESLTLSFAPKPVISASVVSSPSPDSPLVVTTIRPSEEIRSDLRRSIEPSITGGAG